MHNLKLLRRRFPTHYPAMEGMLVLLSVSALAIGVGLLML